MEYLSTKQQGAYQPWMQYAFIALAIWSLAWKGLALYRAARREEKWWFVAILILNTVGLLEIFYIYLLPRIKSWIKPTPTAKKSVDSKKKRR